MNLLREYIRESLKKELLTEKKERIKSLDDVKTVGHLKALINYVRAKKAGKEGGKGIADTVIDIAVDEIQGMIPGFATAKNLFMAAKDVYDLDDKAQVGALASLNVDDDVSKVIDDAIENEFLKDWELALSALSDDKELEEIDVTKALSNWMKKKYDNTTVSKGEA